MNYLEFNISEILKKKVADFISNFTHAPLLSIPAFILLNFFLLDWADFILISGICVFFAALLPVGILIFWTKSIKKDEVDLPKKEDRYYPFLIVIGSYFIGTVFLFALNAPPITTCLMFCYFSNTLIVFFINLYWKISVHSMGVAGPSTALFFTFSYYGLILALLIPLVMWSRVYLNRHTMPQVIAGASLGFILTGIQIKILYEFLFNANLDIFPFLWVIYAFIGPALVLSIAGYLNINGMKDGYTRKFFHFIGFISIVIFLHYAPLGASVSFIASGILYVAISCFSGKGFLWLEGMKRKSDAPYEIFYVILPMLSTILGLCVAWVFLGHPYVEIGMLCVAIGDAIAEPVGVTLGKHKYFVHSLVGHQSQRSWEGSLAVMITCGLIVFIATNNVIVSLLISLILAYIEAVSPRGTDNFTLCIAAALMVYCWTSFLLIF